jgi:hypothetical protein
VLRSDVNVVVPVPAAEPVTVVVVAIVLVAVGAAETVDVPPLTSDWVLPDVVFDELVVNVDDRILVKAVAEVTGRIGLE